MVLRRENGDTEKTAQAIEKGKFMCRHSEWMTMRGRER